MRLHCLVILLCVYALPSLAAEEIKRLPDEAPRGEPSHLAQEGLAEDAAKGTSIWAESEYRGSTRLGLRLLEGTDTEASAFRPRRELRLRHASSLALGAYSLHGTFLFDANRDAFEDGKDRDEDYSEANSAWNRGRILHRDWQFLTNSLYAQLTQDHLTARIGLLQIPWGVADSVSPTDVFNPQDLRAFPELDKERSRISLPAAQATLIGEASQLSLVVADGNVTNVLPQNGHNTWIDKDDFRFAPQLFSSSFSKSHKPSYAVKFTSQIAQGEWSVLYYEGMDHDIHLVPRSLEVNNDAPFSLNLNASNPSKTSYGASYNQTLGSWVLKGEVLFTPNKQGLPLLDSAQLETSSFPMENRTSQHVASTVGVNYFLPLSKIWGIDIGETVVTGEYHQSRYLDRRVSPSLLSGVAIAGLRTSLLEDRLELQTALTRDVVQSGQAVIYGGTLFAYGLRHDLTYTQMSGTANESGQAASMFFYWRQKDYISYEMTLEL